MRRRALLAGSLAAIAVSTGAWAQAKDGAPRLGYLSNSRGNSKPDSAFIQRLRQLGYADFQNLLIQARYTNGDSARFAEFAEELVRSGVHVSAAWSPAGVAAAQRATKSIPIVGISRATFQGAGGSVAGPFGRR